jgi:hypothetical protein
MKTLVKLLILRSLLTAILGSNMDASEARKLVEEAKHKLNNKEEPHVAAWVEYFMKLVKEAATEGKRRLYIKYHGVRMPSPSDYGKLLVNDEFEKRGFKVDKDYIGNPYIDWS